VITYKAMYVANGDTSASFDGEWLRCTGFNLAVMHVEWSAAPGNFNVEWSAAPGNFNGNFTVEGTNDETFANPIQLQFSLLAPGGGAASVVSSANASGTSAGGILIVVGDGLALPEFVRLRYARTSGGQANHVQVPLIGRQ
jgi:hypothetical protein